MAGDLDPGNLVSTTTVSGNTVQDFLIHRDVYTVDFNVDKRLIFT